MASIYAINVIKGLLMAQGYQPEKIEKAINEVALDKTK